MRVLGIETTCDETAAAVVRLRPAGGGDILSDEVMSQIATHAAYGGVVPEIAARAHIEVVDHLVARALKRAKLAVGDLDGIAAAAGPGLIGGVLVGLMTGKGLALAARKPFMAVNHLEAHALTARLTDNVAFPYLLLLASGGHTQILAVKGVGQYRSARNDDGRRDRRGVRQDRQGAWPALSRRARHRGGGQRRRSHALRPAAPDARPPHRGFLALRLEDGDASGGPERCAVAAERCRRPQRVVPGGDRRHRRRQNSGRPEVVS